MLAAASAASAERDLYVAGSAGNNVEGFHVAPSGALTSFTTAALGASTMPEGIAFAPNGQFMYVGEQAADKVAAFRVASDGTLSAIGGSPFPAGDGPFGVAITPNGRFLYVVDFNTTTLTGYSVDATSGALTELPASPFPVGTSPSGVAITPDGTHLYVTNQVTNNINAFTIGADGALAAVNGSPFSDAGTFPFGASITPDGGRLYVGHIGSGNVTGYSIAANGALTTLAGSPFAGGTAPASATASTSGGRVYAVDRTAGNVLGFNVGTDGGLGSITGSPFAAGAGARWGVFVNGGSRYYVDNFTDNTISEYTVSAVDGTLNPISASPVATVATSPATFAIAATPDQGPLAAFSFVAGGSGKPTTFNGGISTDPDGTVFRYDWNFGDGTTLPDGGPTPTHTYANPGDYTATLTVTDEEGCSTKVIFTGQTPACNGSSLARASRSVNVPDLAPPVLSLSGKRSQKLGKSVSVKAKCNESCLAKATGQLVVRRGKRHAKVRTRRFKLKKATAQIAAGAKKTLKLKISKKGRKAATAALATKGKVAAKLEVKAIDAAGNATTKTRAVKVKAARH